MEKWYQLIHHYLETNLTQLKTKKDAGIMDTRRDAKEIAIPMTGPSIRQYYNRLLFSIGIRNQKKRRHDFSVHGFRKYFKTRAEQAGMKPINVEILMGHSVGISDSYYRPTENELLQDYLHVKDALTISPPSSFISLLVSNFFKHSMLPSFSSFLAS